MLFRFSTTEFISLTKVITYQAMSTLKITNLPWEHVLCRQIFPCLSLSTIFKLRSVSKEFKKLVQLYFSSAFTLNFSTLSEKMTTDAFQIMTENSYYIKRLNLSNARNWLQNGGLVPVLRCNSQLTVINLDSCSGLTNVTLQALATSCKELQILILRSCHWVSNEGLLCLAPLGLNLVHLDITGCWNVEDAAIRACVEKLKNLEVISLAKIYGVTNDTIIVLAKTCKALRHVNIRGCWRVTNDAIWTLGEYCSTLCLLEVKDCRDITEAILCRLRVKGIRLDIPTPPKCPNLALLAAHPLYVQT